MINKSTIIVTLSSLALIYTSAYSQNWKDNWRKSPLTTTTSNEWRNKPYRTTTSDTWRNSPFSARQSESKLRWNRSKWQKSPSYWRTKPYVERPVASDRWQNRWNKMKWRYSLINWKYPQLRYKNTIKRYESEPIVREVRVFVLSDEKSENASFPEEKTQYEKAQIETINGKAEIISEKAPNNLGHNGNYFTVISGKQTFGLEKNVQKTIHMAPGGLIEIYSSGSESH